jgi:hypothetical protein
MVGIWSAASLNENQPMLQPMSRALRGCTFWIKGSIASHLEITPSTLLAG